LNGRTKAPGVKYMKDIRKVEVYVILFKKIRSNIDVLFDFTLDEQEFKETYKVTKEELQELIGGSL
jgi:hypothetical protein